MALTQKKINAVKLVSDAIDRAVEQMIGHDNFDRVKTSSAGIDAGFGRTRAQVQEDLSRKYADRKGV